MITVSPTTENSKLSSILLSPCAEILCTEPWLIVKVVKSASITIFSTDVILIF